MAKYGLCKKIIKPIAGLTAMVLSAGVVVCCKNDYCSRKTYRPGWNEILNLENNNPANNSYNRGPGDGNGVSSGNGNSDGPSGGSNGAPGGAPTQ